VIAFFGYGLATRGWMILVIIVFGAFGGITGPALQGLVAGTVSPSEQGRIQGALTSLQSVTSVLAPLIFTSGVFAYFTSDAAPFELPGAPFLLGGVMMAIAWVIVTRLFRRLPAESER